jgi:pyrroline-5-carboxylate reductase
MGFMGGGRVVQILLGGLKKAGKMPRQAVVSDPSPEVLDLW